MGVLPAELNNRQQRSSMMKAIMKRTAGPGAELCQVPIPKIAPDEVLVEVRATSICGTDLHIFEWNEWAAKRIKAPLVMGHEFAGVVVEVGEQVQTIQVGDHVSAETHLICRRCPQCLSGDFHICRETQIIGVDTPGCFAQYVKLPAENIWKNEKTMPFATAALQEPLGNAVHTVLAGPIAGKTVAVMGCGPIGLMAVAVAKAAGAAKVLAIDINEFRLKIARQVGATITINTSKYQPSEVMSMIKALTDGEGAEVVCEMSGHPLAIQQAFEMVANGGRLSILSLPSKPVTLDLAEQLVSKGITVQGITGRKIFATWRQTAQFLHTGMIQLEPLITHTLPMEEFEHAFALMREGRCGKVVLLPSTKGGVSG